MKNNLIDILNIVIDENYGSAIAEEAEKAVAWLNSSKSPHQLRVEEFMEKAGQEVPSKIIDPSEEVKLLWARLILEESLETIEALGYETRVKGILVSYGNAKLTKVFPTDLEEVIDGCCDLKFVATGALSMFGIPDMPFQQEVDAANLRKFTGDAHRREDGKWIKPSNWTPPNHHQILEELI